MKNNNPIDPMHSIPSNSIPQNLAQFQNSDISNQSSISINLKSKKKIRRLLPTKRPVEEIGLVPRSIIRTFSRFIKQMFFETTDLVVQEFRISRYQVLVSIQCLLILIFIPLLTNLLATNFIFKPLTEYFWNTNQNEIFLNSYQQNRAFLEMQQFENQLYFEVLLNSQIEQNDEVKEHNQLNNLPKQILYKNAQNQKQLNEGVLSQAPIYLIKQKPISEEIMELNQKISIMSIDPMRSIPLNSNNPLIPLNSNQLIHLSELIETSIELNTAQPFYQSFLTTSSFNANNYLDKSIIIVSTKQIDGAQNAPLISNEKNSLTVTRNINSSLNTENYYNDSISLFTQEFSKRVQQKTLELAFQYNQQSINALNNLFGDLITLITLFLLFVGLKPQIIILKSFLLESLYSLSDTTKSFLLILGTDLLVGFHSPRGWEVFIDFLLNRFGFPHNENFIFLFVATFPVLLDTVFKYWIFRYLNKISPSTVATYHAMIE